MCDGCKSWFRPKCKGLSVEAFRALSKYDFLWLCISCKPRVMAILDVGMNLESRIEKAEKKIGVTERDTGDKSVPRTVEGHSKDGEVSESNKRTANKNGNINEGTKGSCSGCPRYTEELKNSVHEIKRLVVSQDKEDR